MGPAACSGGDDGDGDRASRDGGADGAGGASMDGGDPFGNADALDAQVAADAGSLPTSSLVLEPDSPRLMLQHGRDADPLQFTVRDGAGRPQAARFALDSNELGSIDDQGLFTPNGLQGGLVGVEARVGDRVLRTTVEVTIHWEQNGGVADLGSGSSSGGRGGVGGEGEGPAVSTNVERVLSGTPEQDAALRFLYPYDDTVMPLGLLAPLLMWSEPEGGGVEIDGVRLDISGPRFEYTGLFARPSALAADAPFVRHPIPQEVWESATATVAGAGLNVEITLSRAGKAIGPIRTALRIAAGRLQGTVYYQSYGTQLAKNYEGAMGGDGRFGGATLAIKPGAIEPSLVAGGDGGHEQCRVCHSVSSDGSRMTVQHGDRYDTTSSYDLQNGYAEMGYPDTSRSLLAWIGLSPDGNYGLGNSEPLLVNAQPRTELYDMNTGMVVPTTGLRDFVDSAAFPAFSHDGEQVAFNLFGGPGTSETGPGDTKKLVAMDFDATAFAFSNPRLLYEGDLPAGWPSFTPGSNGVVFALEVKRGEANNFFETRLGAQGELWWSSLRTGTAHRLERANGTANGASYLPTSPANHETDELLNYEPTIAPIASGGYAWMVFTSRRLYGNVATIDPWFSDPRNHDLTTTPTTKKLWVAAIDLDVDSEELSVTAPDDPSHPAFYLPGQELLAGNTRGFWVVDPCRQDGDRCETGVDCCSGFCQLDEATEELTCGRKRQECSKEFEACETRADCCDPMLQCINDICSRVLVD